VKRIFLTGGTGFIGSHFLSEAVGAGHEVITLRRTQKSRPRFALPFEPQWLDKNLCDVSSADFGGCDSLVHLAAVGVDNPGACSWEEAIRINVTESIRLLIAASQAGIRRMIVCGSCFEYGRVGERFQTIPASATLEPTGPYHASKAAATLAAYALAIEQNLEMMILRPFHVYGEGEAEHRFWPALRRAAFAGEDFPMTPGGQVRDFIPVRDLARAFLNALDEKEISRGEPIIENIGTGKATTLLHFAASWWKQWNAAGRLLPGALAYRRNEVMNYIPEISERCHRWMKHLAK